MKTILLIIVICLYSCTPSGKLTDAKFPYYSNLNQVYNGSLTTPLNVGSYAITVTPRMPCVECEFAKMHLQVVIIFAIMIAACYIGIFIHDWWIKRDEEITLPDEFNENY